MAGFVTGADKRLNEALLENLTPAFKEIPVVDISAATSPNKEDRIALAKTIRKACETIGFFYVSNHGVPQEVIDNTFQQAKEFFKAPLEVKNEINVAGNIHKRGYIPINRGAVSDKRKDAHESVDFGTPNVSFATSKDEWTPDANFNNWPTSHPQVGIACETYFHEVVKLGRKLLHLFALSLDLEETFFDEYTKGPGCIARIIHYPPQEPTKLDPSNIGIGAHSDWELFTILAQDEVPALQVLNADNEWIQATPIPGTFVINVADSLMRWTNDLFQSTVHRAINISGRERFSIPLFWGADYDCSIKPLESCVSEERPSRYQEIQVQEYIKWRSEQTYSVHTVAPAAAPQITAAA